MLKVKNLTFEVNEEGKKRCLVNHISFDVQDGEMLVITGPNGGGKSTLAKVLAGIEKADSGEIYLDDENITGYDIDHRANAGIGYAFQQPPRFKGMTVARMLSLAAGKNLTEKVRFFTFSIFVPLLLILHYCSNCARNSRKKLLLSSNDFISSWTVLQIKKIVN